MAHRADGLNDIFEHDITVRENVNTKGGTIQDNPTNDKDLVNKKYVDDGIGSDHPHQDVTTTAEVDFKTITTTEGCDFGGWVGIPSPISIHTNVNGDVIAGADGVDVARIKFGSNYNHASVQYNRYFDGTNSQQMDTSIPSYQFIMGTGGDEMALTRCDAGTVNAVMTDLFRIDGATGEVQIPNDLDVTGNIIVDGTVDGVDIAARDHAESHDIASHSDTTATGAELNTLTDNSVANTLHRHSELVASDGSPDPVISVAADGKVGLGTASPQRQFHIHNDIFPYMHMTTDTTGSTSTDGLSIGIDQPNNQSFVRMRENMPLQLWTNNLQRLEIGADGKVGIGQGSGNDPTDQLQVVDSIDTGADWTSNGKSVISVVNEYEADDAATILKFWNFRSGGVYPNSGRAQGGIVYEYVNSSRSKKLTITENLGTTETIVLKDGDVGIGDSTPACKLEVNGAVASGQTTCSASSDAFDVSGVNSVLINAGDGAVVLGGFSGGVAGQIVHVAIIDSTNNVTIEHNEGTGTQKFFLCDESDDVLDDYGGWTFVCDGSNWYDCGHAKHI